MRAASQARPSARLLPPMAAPTAVSAPADADHYQVRVTGVLIRDAELRFSTGPVPHGLLFLHLSQGQGLPYEARQDCGTEPAHLIAAGAKQRLLRKGAVVTVYARSITPRTDHSTAVLRLVGVTDVLPHHCGDRRHQEL